MRLDTGRLALSRLLLAALCALAAAPAAAQARFDFERQATLLPKAVVPSRVQLRLDLDPARRDFGGEVVITLRVREPVAAIVLHAHELQADDVSLQGRGPARRLQVAVDAGVQQWRLSPADGRPIAAGTYALRIRYRGKVQRTDEGLYLVEHRVDGRPSRLLSTQLEATNARQVLPIFDEPVFRARFELEVRAPAEYAVLSNMPLRAAPVTAGAQTRHRFLPTPPMPSYLLAVTVGRFDVLEDRVGSTPLRIFTAPGKREQARRAMTATQQLLPYFTGYFGVPYALPKLDQLAVPGVRQGAMEDWGLISYIESLLLFEEGRSNPATEQAIFSVVAHEIAHQWFGNLVSAASWSEIWLNEAFATWMQRKAMARFHPEWQSRLHERIDTDDTLDRDATPATRAIRSGPVSEESVFEVFDDITYSKGGSVLTMLEQWVGPDRFQRGLAAYMTERAMQPATAGDLWSHIGTAAALPAAEVAASWTDQPGLPLVEVEARCEGGETVLQLRQSRFTTSEPLPAATWQIPLTLARGDETRTVLMTAAAMALRWPGCDERPLLVNAGGSGYYRVDYDPALRQRLLAAFAGLSPLDRINVLADSFALVRAGRRPAAEHLALLARLPQVTDASRPALFAQALDQWRQLFYTYEATPTDAPLRAAGRALFGAELARLGWQPQPGEASEVAKLRGPLINALSVLGDADTVAEARRRYGAALSGDSARLPSSLRGSVLAAVSRDADAAEFEALWERLHASESQEERRMLLQAICAGTDAARAQRLLEASLSGRLPPDISIRLVEEMGAVTALRPQVYAFAVAHWTKLAELGGQGPFGGRNWLLPDIVEWSSDAAVAARLLDDQARLAGATGKSSAEKIAAAIRVRARLREREGTPLAEALRGWVPLQ